MNKYKITLKELKEWLNETTEGSIDEMDLVDAIPNKPK